MDLVSYSALEASLAAQGLAVQAGILDNFAAYRYLILVVFAIGLVWLLWRGALQGGVVEVVAYVVICVIVWFAIPQTVNVSIAPKLPPEERLSEAQKQEIESPHGVNFAFALFTKLLDTAANVAASQISNITSTDGYIRVTGSYAEGVAQLLQARLPKDSEVAKDLKHFFTANKNSCEELWHRYASSFWDPGKNNLLNPWVCAIKYMYAPDNPDNKLGYLHYQKAMWMAANTIPWAKSGEGRKQFEACIKAPETIHRKLYNTLARDLATGKMASDGPYLTAVSAASVRLWAFLSGGHGDNLKKKIIQRVAAKNVWTLAAPSFANNTNFIFGLSRFVADIKDRWGAVEGTVKAASVMRYAPIARGVAKLLLAASFPFICLFLFLPNGWSWMRRWIRLMVAVYLWQVLDMIALGIIDDVAWRKLSELATAAQGVSVDPYVLVWVQGILLGASPVLAYVLSGVGGGAGVEGAVSGPGIGGVARAAAAGLRRLA